MIKLIIDRNVTGPEGTFGMMRQGLKPFALTLEREWLNNRRGKSCVPAGEYTCTRCRTSPEYNFQDSPKFGDTFMLVDVKGRKYILFHKGNLNQDTHGCILVGEQFGELQSSTALLASRAGFDEFLELLRDVDQFELSIRNHF